MKQQLRQSILACVVALAASVPAPAFADLFDPERGVVDLSAAAFSLDFEVEEPEGLRLFRYDADPRPSDEGVVPSSAVPALSGHSVGELGGDLRRMTFILADETKAQFEGRRVEMRMWYRPSGTRANARVVWLSGNVEGQLRRGEPTFNVHNMGEIAFQPTGRRTSDGWFELTTGPVDFEVGATLPPAYVEISDANHFDSGIEPIVARDPDARAYVDAFSIEDLGPATIPDLSCSAIDEAVCGEHGLCHLGRCTDAAAYLGAAPQDDELREAYLARRRFEIETFSGPRIIADYEDLLNQQLTAAASDVALDFWTGMIRAVNGISDGHSSAPRARATSGVAGGACAYYGLADLLPSSPEGLIVWESFDQVPYGAQMQTGDVITSIGGLSPSQFAETVDREKDYGGDRRAWDVIDAPNLLRWAAQTGTSWEVTRCDQDEPCTEAQLQTFTVDPTTDLDPLWASMPPSFRFIVPLCDFRVDRLNGEPDERSYGFAGTRSDDDVEIVMFNGFPPADTGGGQSGWLVTLTNVMNQQPPYVILDQRWGTGGYPDALQGLTDLLLAASDPPQFGETFPSGPVPEGAARRGLQRNCGQRNCGMYFAFGQTPDVDGPAANTRIALLNGYDVSANDFFTRRLADRPDRTRIFGHGPIFGAYGFACSVPPHLPGENTVGYQCTDTTFSTSQSNPDGVFESGYGVEPDEVVLQKQSDLRLGVDSMRVRALEWLKEGL